MSFEPKESNVRRRRTGRADAFDYLTASLLRPSRTKLANVQKVVCYNIWLDLIAFHIGSTTAEYFENSNRYPYIAPRMGACIIDEVLKMGDDLNEAVYEAQAEERIMTYVRTLDDNECITLLNNFRTSRFYNDAMNNQVGFVQDLKKISEVPLGPPDPEQRRISSSCKSWEIKTSFGEKGQPFTAAYRNFATINEDRLVFLLNTLRELRASIATAASASHLPEDLLAELGYRLQEFDKGGLYALACSTVSWGSPKQQSLVANSQNWWSITSNIPKKTDKLGEATSTYARTGEKMRSTLTFIVPTICLLSVIPTALAWKHSDFALGTTFDSNFWQTILGSTMQLLGLVTFIWPTLKHPRLSPLVWVWIWILAGFSAACAIASIPLFLVCPTIWSFLVSAAGVLAQAFVQLQVINAL